MLKTSPYNQVTLTWTFCFVFGCISSAVAGSCVNRIALLSDELYNLVRNDNRITATTSAQGYSPRDVRMSNSGWCSVSLSSMCGEGVSGSMQQYVMVDFGAEAVVEAVGTAASDNSNYMSGYAVEYARSDMQFFSANSEDSNSTFFEGNSACVQSEQQRQLYTPVIARYIRIVPLEWVGPMICFKMELYGCFVRECPVVNNLGDDRALLPDSNIDVSSDYGPVVGNQRDIREVWCAEGTDTTPNIILTFTEPLYIVYATTRGTSIYWVRDYSYYFVNTSGRSLYSNVDGHSAYGQSSNDRVTVPLWTPIPDASVLEIRIDDFVPIFACFGIKLYGCTSNEVIDHSAQLSNSSNTLASIVAPSTTTTSTTTSRAMTTLSSFEESGSHSAVQSTITVISTIQPSIVTVIVAPSASISVQTVLITPTVQCGSQESSSSSNDNSCNAVAICIPVMIVIAVIVIVVIFVVIWRLRHYRKFNLGVVNPRFAHVDNDLYGMENTDVVKYDYPVVPFKVNNNELKSKNNEKMVNKQPTPPIESSTSASIVKSSDSTTANKSMDNPLYGRSKSTVVSEKT